MFHVEQPSSNVSMCQCVNVTMFHGLILPLVVVVLLDRWVLLLLKKNF